MKYRIYSIVVVTVLALLPTSHNLHANEVPFEVMVKLSRAHGYQRTGRYDEAIELYQEVVRAVPQAGQAWLGLGRSYNMTGRYQLAVEPLQQAVQTCRDQQSTWNALGNAFYGIEDYSKSEACYTNSLDQGDNDIIYYNRGNARRCSGKTQDAIHDYDRAIEINDQDPEYFNDRGIAYWDLEDWRQAATDFSKACAMEPKNEVMVQNYRSAIVNMEAWDALIQSARVLLKKAPDNSESHYMLALGNWNQGNTNAAKRAVDRAIELNDEQPEFYELRAEIFESMGRSREASADLRQAEALWE